MPSPAKSDFISKTKAATKSLVESINSMRALAKQYVASGGSNWLTQEDFVGDNSHLVKTDLDLVMVSLSAIEALITKDSMDSKFYKMF